MKITIIFFSQTGNTRKVADAMSGRFLAAGHSVRVLPMKEATPDDATECDLLGFGSPCFTSQAPVPVKAFLKSLPSLKGRRAFVFVTSGAAPGRTMYDLGSALQKKGADVAGGILVHSECFFPAPCLVGRMAGRPDDDDLARVRKFADAMAEHVSAGRPGFAPGSRDDILKIRGGFYDYVALLNRPGFLRLTLPKPVVMAGRCNGCGWCVRECPAGNITMQEYPVIGHGCIRCYHCLNGCPQQAFSARWTFSNLVVKSLYNTVFIKLFGDLEPGEKIYR